MGLNLYKELAAFSEILFDATYTSSDILQLTKPQREIETYTITKYFSEDS